MILYCLKHTVKKAAEEQSFAFIYVTHYLHECPTAEMQDCASS